VNAAPGVVFTILHFWSNKLECLSLANHTAYCNVAHELIGPIRKLQRKRSVVNTAPVLNVMKLFTVVIYEFLH
jgi:hypothetical protein